MSKDKNKNGIAENFKKYTDLFSEMTDRITKMTEAKTAAEDEIKELKAALPEIGLSDDLKKYKQTKEKIADLEARIEMIDLKLAAAETVPSSVKEECQKTLGDLRAEHSAMPEKIKAEIRTHAEAIVKICGEAEKVVNDISNLDKLIRENIGDPSSAVYESVKYMAKIGSVYNACQKLLEE